MREAIRVVITISFLTYLNLPYSIAIPKMDVRFVIITPNYSNRQGLAEIGGLDLGGVLTHTYRSRRNFKYGCQIREQHTEMTPFCDVLAQKIFSFLP